MGDPITDHLYNTGISISSYATRKCEKVKVKGLRMETSSTKPFLTCHLMDRLSKTLYVAGGDASDGNPAIFSRVY